MSLNLKSTADGTKGVIQVNDIDALVFGTTAEFKVPAVATITDVTVPTFDMRLGNNFNCTVSAPGTLEFTYINAGQAGNIIFTNSSGDTISKMSYVASSASFLATISASGTYFITYYSPDGVNVAVSTSGAIDLVMGGAPL